MKKKIQEHIREFGKTSKGETQKLEKVFEWLESAKKAVQPRDSFKKHLAKRLKTLAEMKGVSRHIQKRQYHLFAGVFASFLFVGVFLIFMSESLFKDPISWKNLELQGAKVFEETHKNLESKANTEVVPSTKKLSKEDVLFWPSSVTTQSEDSSSTESDTLTLPTTSSQKQESAGEDSSLKTEEENNTLDTESKILEQQEFAWDISEEGNSLSLQENGDLPQEKPWDNNESDSIEEESIEDMDESGEWLSFPEASSVNALQDTSFDTPMRSMEDESSSWEDSDFQKYCQELGWIYHSTPTGNSCKKEEILCYEREFIEKWLCFWGKEIPESEDYEIFLEDLMDDFSQ